MRQRLRNWERTRYLGGVVVLGLVAARALVSPAQDQTCVPPPLQMSAWWSGNGNANDVLTASPGSADATVTYAAGKVGQAFNFTANHAGVKIPSSQRIDVGAGTGMTVEAWINPATATPGEPLFEWNNGQTFGVHLWIHEANGQLYGNFMDIGGVAHFIKTAPGVVAANTYQHIAMTYDKTTGVAQIYRNGESVAQERMGQFRPQTTTGFDFYLGLRPAGLGAGQRYLGGMDEVGLYRRALPATEIQRIFNAGAGGKCAPGTAAAGTPGTGAPGIGRTTGTTAAPGTTGTTAPGTTRTTGIGTTGTGPALLPTPTPRPAPVVVPTPTPIPVAARPNPTGPVAVLDFTVASGIDPTVGHRVSDALAAALQQAGFDVRTRSQIEQAMGNAAQSGGGNGQTDNGQSGGGAIGGNNTATRRPMRHAEIEAAQKQQAQSVSAGSMIVGRITGLKLANGKSAQLSIEVRQLEVATGAFMDGITVSETTTPRPQAVLNQALLNEVLNKSVASIVRALRPKPAAATPTTANQPPV